MKKIIYLIILMGTVCSCLKEYDLKLNKSEKLLVVDGLITDGNGPYYVRLTKSLNKLNVAYINSVWTGMGDSYKDSAEAVINAKVIISDNLGNVDTLISVPKYYGGYVQFYNGTKHAMDSVWNQQIEEYYSFDKGFYRTSKIKGVSGRTYYLKVISEGKAYQSQCYMTPLPKFDSLSYEKKVSEQLKGEEYYSPLLYFTKPKDINYFLFQFSNVFNNNVLPTINPLWNWDASITSTKYLSPYVNGLDVTIGSAVAQDFAQYRFENATDASKKINLTVLSLTKEGYDYYKNLIDQLKNDGGAFKPTPASPKGNISNEALGFFRASAMSVLQKKINN